MSFSKRVKKEILSLPAGSASNIKAELYGMFLLQKDLFKNKILIKRASELISNISDIRNLKIADINSLIVKNLPQDNVDFDLGLIKSANLKAFLRGIFISCGTITDPASNYHLEFNVPSFSLSMSLFKILENANEINFKPGAIRRRKGSLIYIKDSEKITDFLTFIGVQKSAMEIMQIKMMKEVRNHINRTTNCETANILKTTTSAAEQIVAVKLIKSVKGLEWLPKHLKETADLRLSYPYASLEELSGLCKIKISKSGMNHRLKKLIKMSQAL